MTMETPNFTFIDLFCGAGGFSVGFKASGFQSLLAIDHDQAAVKTYKLNIDEHVLLSEVTPEMDLPRADVIIGGPPCQGFSSAGMRRFGDHRNSLVATFAQLIAKYKPTAFVFENVEGFLTAENGTRVFDLLIPLLEAGYRIHFRKVNVANYGIPQHRKRVIVLGGLGWDPSFPKPTHTAFGAPGAFQRAKHLTLTPTLIECIGDLPSPASEPPGWPIGHFCRPLQGLDKERASALLPGMTMRDLPEHLQHGSYRKRAFRRVMDGTPTERRGGAPAGLRRLKPDEPSKAITGGARSEFIHPTQNRPLTIRECARLQTFPDDFVFVGSPSEQMQLIGNAVPPIFASVLANNLHRDLCRENQRHDEGALLSFVPTVSDGFSPILRRVDRMVKHRLEKFLFAEEFTLWR